MTGFSIHPRFGITICSTPMRMCRGVRSGMHAGEGLLGRGSGNCSLIDFGRIATRACHPFFVTATGPEQPRTTTMLCAIRTAVRA